MDIYILAKLDFSELETEDVSLVQLFWCLFFDCVFFGVVQVVVLPSSFGVFETGGTPFILLQRCLFQMDWFIEQIHNNKIGDCSAAKGHERETD